MANYRIPELTPPPGKPAGQATALDVSKAPPNATGVFFYSERETGSTGVGTVQAGSGDPVRYTRELSLNAPDARQFITEYLAKFPDARLVAFGDGLTNASMPTAASPPLRSFTRGAEP
jgi:hypothetical protein